MTRLVAVTVKFNFVMVVADETPVRELEDIARGHIADATRDLSCNQFGVTTRTYQSGAIWEWDDACLPYGGDGNSTTADYLKAA